MSSRNQVLTNNTNSFPNNNSGQITPQVLRDFNADFINSTVFLDQTSSMSVASASNATNAVSASFASNAANANSASYALTASFALNGGGGGTVNTGSLLLTASAVFSTITFTKGDGSTFDVTVAQSGSVATASYALFAVSASQAVSASYAPSTPAFPFTGSARITGSLGVTGSVSITNGLEVKAGDLDFNGGNVNIYNGNITQFAGASSFKNFVATGSLLGTASNASAVTLVTDNGNTNHKVLFTNGTTDSSNNQVLIDPGTNFTYNPNADRLTVTNLSVPGTASFGYVQTVTGSAVIIGQEFIILNANPPTARYAGIKVYDTGSATTASFQWDGNTDNWIIVEETGLSAGILTGPTGSLGSEVFPTTNTILKGTGHHTVGDSNITDNGSLVSINSTLYSSGSVGIGTSVPLDVLHVAKNAPSTNIGVSIQNLDSLSPSHVRFLDYQGTIKAAITLVQQEPSLRFLVNGQDRLIIDDTGNIGVGVNPQNAQYLLDVNGIIRSTTGLLVTGSVGISGSTDISGSVVINNVLTLTGSQASPSRFNLKSNSSVATVFSANDYFIEDTAGTVFGGNIVTGTTPNSATASYQLSGSQNWINVTTLGSNANFIAGRRFGHQGRQNIIFNVPNVVSASNMTMPSLSTSWIAGAITITNNWTGAPTISNTFVNSSLTLNPTSGSVGLSNTNVNSGTTLTNTWASSSITLTANQLIGSSLTINTFTTASDSSAKSFGVLNNILAGNTLTAHIKSGSANGTALANTIVVSNNFVVTGSGTLNQTNTAAAFFGSWPVTDGRLNDVDQIRFAVGTGTATGTRKTSLFVSASGLTVIQDGLLVTGSVTATSFTGSLLGTASFATNTTSASYALTATSASFATNATSASYANNATSASYSLTSTSASYADNAVTASYVQLAQSASFAVTASYALNANAGGVQASDIYSYTFLLMGA